MVKFTNPEWPNSINTSSLEGKIITEVLLQTKKHHVWRKTIENWKDFIDPSKKLKDTCHIYIDRKLIRLVPKRRMVVEGDKFVPYEDSKTYKELSERWKKEQEEREQSLRCDYCEQYNICFCGECHKKLCEYHSTHHDKDCDHLSPYNPYT